MNFRARLIAGLHRLEKCCEPVNSQSKFLSKASSQAPAARPGRRGFHSHSIGGNCCEMVVAAAAQAG